MSKSTRRRRVSSPRSPRASAATAAGRRDARPKGAPASRADDRTEQRAAWSKFASKIEMLVAIATRLGLKDASFDGIASVLAALVRIMRAYAAGEALGLSCDLVWSNGEFENSIFGQRLELRLKQETSEYTADERRAMLDIEEARDRRYQADYIDRVTKATRQAERDGSPESYAARKRTSTEYALAIGRVQDLERELAEAREAAEKAKAINEQAYASMGAP